MAGAVEEPGDLRIAQLMKVAVKETDGAKVGGSLQADHVIGFRLQARQRVCGRDRNGKDKA